MVVVSIIVDKSPVIYERDKRRFMRGFIIAYFDIRPLLNENKTFKDLLGDIIRSMKFIGEDLLEEDAQKIIRYLHDAQAYIMELDDKMIFVIENGEEFLSFFEQILRSRLKQEYNSLVKYKYQETNIND